MMEGEARTRVPVESKRRQHIIGRTMAVVVTSALLVMFGHNAESTESSDGAASGPRILPVVTLKTGAEASYWWQTPSDPQWTPFDDRLRKTLEREGVRTVDFTDTPRISQIYQRPDLSLQNAAALCSLLDVRRLLHGTVTVREFSPGPAHGTALAVARADLQFVDTGGRAPTVLQEVAIDRTATAPSMDVAIENVQRRVGEAAGEIVGRITRGSDGRTGFSREEPMIGVWGARKAATLERLQRKMQKADEVDTVVRRWAAEGVVGFEVNPGQQDPARRIEYVARTILEDRISWVTLRRREREISGMVSLEVTDEKIESDAATP